MGLTLKSAEIIKPLLRGREIRKYGFNFNDNYVIFSHNGLKENKKNVSSQLEGVSEVISQMAQEIEQKEDDPYLNQKQEILNFIQLILN